MEKLSFLVFQLIFVLKMYDTLKVILLSAQNMFCIILSSYIQGYVISQIASFACSNYLCFKFCHWFYNCNYYCFSWILVGSNLNRWRTAKAHNSLIEDWQQLTISSSYIKQITTEFIVPKNKYSQWMIPKTLKVGLCVNVQEILNHCFQQFKYFTDIFLTISDNKRFTISSFINPFQSRVAFHIETSLFILNQITGFCIEFKTGLKWIKQSS